MIIRALGSTPDTVGGHIQRGGWQRHPYRDGRLEMRDHLCFVALLIGVIKIITEGARGVSAILIA